MWEILGIFPDQNNQVRVVAKRGSAVLHMGRLTPEAAAAVGQDELNKFWAAR